MGHREPLNSARPSRLARPTRRQVTCTVLGLGAGVGLAFSLTSCEPPRTSESPPSGDRVVIGETRDAGTLLPVLESSSLDGEINAMLYPTLNSAHWKSGTIEYLVDERSLAESWEFGPDWTTLTYHLRRDAVWSDGQPITAHDAVFTYELIRRPEIGSPRVDYWEHLDSVVARGDHEVTFFFRRRYPGMLFHTGVIGIIPAHIFEPHSLDNAALVSHPTLTDSVANLVVAGPFRVAEWRRGEQLVLVPNTTSFAPQPRLKRVVFRIIPEETTRLVELENGTVDMIAPIPLESAEKLAADPRFRIETIEDRYYDYIAWNGAKFEPFADPDVRYALSLAIDRKAILAGLGIERYATPAAGPYPPIFPKLLDPSLRPDPYLPDSAQAILAAKGWRDSDGDRFLDRDGQRFRFTLLTPANNKRRVSAAVLIQAQYTAIGVDMRVRQIEFNALLDIMFEQRDFEAVLLGWAVGLDPEYLLGLFSPPDQPFNITGYESPAMESLISLAQAATTEDEAAGHWRAVARTIARDRPYAFLWFFSEVVALSDRIRSTRIDTYGLYQNLHEWTLEP